MTFEVWIPGPPVAWARTGKRTLPNGITIFYDRKKQVAWKSTFSLHAQEELRHMGARAPLFQHPIPVRVTIVCCFSLPASKHRKRDPVPESWYIGREDYDNLGKLVGDAGNELLWADDRQIVVGTPMKVRMAQGEPAGVYVLAEAVPDLRLDEASLYLERARRVAGLVEPQAERRIG